MFPLLLFGGGLVFLFIKGGSASSGPAPLTPAERSATQEAVTGALLHETRKAALTSFAGTLQADFPAEAAALRKKAVGL